MPDHDPRSPWAAPTAGLPTPGDAPSYAYLTAPGYPPAYAPAPVQVRVEAPRPGGRGLAVAGVVLGGLALLGVLLLAVFTFVATFADLGDDPGGGGGFGPMRGTIAPASGSALGGQALAEEVSRQVRDDGGDPEAITCPVTARVAKDVTTVCHGTDAGEDSSFVVFFEDDRGAYTLLEI